MALKKKFFYSIDLGLFLTGILLVVLAQTGSSTIPIRAVIGEIEIVVSYFLLPFIDMQKKDKLAMIFAVNFIALLAVLFICYYSLSVYINNLNGAALWKEILAAMGLLVVISYISFLLINFIRAIYSLSSKLFSFLFNANTKENISNAKSIIEKITAFIVTITALAASIAALFAALKSIMEGDFSAL